MSPFLELTGLAPRLPMREPSREAAGACAAPASGRRRRLARGRSSPWTLALLCAVAPTGAHGSPLEDSVQQPAGERPVGRSFGALPADPDRSASLGLEARAVERPKAPSGWAPTVAVELGGFDEQLRVRTDGVDTDSQRGQVRAGVGLGVAHPVVRLSDWVALDGLASVGLGVTFGSGHWLLPLREDLTFAFTPARWLTLRAGLGLGFSADLSAAQRSFAELALPVSVTFWRTVELAWRPMLTLPLGSDTQAVLGGERALATRVEVLPFDVQLRFRLGGAGW